MKLSFGLIDPGMPGGIYATERPFLEALAGVEGVSVKPFVFGSRSTSESHVKRLVSRSRDVREFAAMLRRDKPDLVQLNSAYDKRALLRDFWFARAVHRARVPLFIKYHGTDASVFQNKLPLWHWISRRIIAWSAGVGVLSTEERRNFLAAGHLSEGIVVVKNAVDVTRLTHLHHPKVPRQLLFIGRFIPSKGLIDVIRAVKLLIDSGVDVSLVCVGDGPDRQLAEKIVTAEGLWERVRFTGQLPEHETSKFYLESCALVFPTYHQEGFPMAIFQAAAAGLPIVTTRIRAAADYLSDPENCLWVNPRAPSMLAQRIKLLLDDPELRSRMATNNRQLVTRFSATVVAQEYLAVYQMLIKGDRIERPQSQPVEKVNRVES